MTQQTQPIRPVSQSELKVFRECRRKWYLGTYLGLKPRSRGFSGAKELGSRIHDVLEAYYSPRMKYKGVDTAAHALGVFDKHTAEEAKVVVGTPAEDEWRKEISLARIMLEGYFEWLETDGEDSFLEIEDAEEQVAVPLLFDGEPVISVAPPHDVLPIDAEGRAPGGTEMQVHLVAKLDVRVRDLRNDQRFFLDHKTVGSINDLPKRADIDEQFLFYVLIEMLLAKERGLDPTTATSGGIYNMLRKVKRTADATPPFYKRYPVHYNTDQIRGYWSQMTGTVRDLLEVERRLAAGEDPKHVVYPTPSRDCDWKCQFRSLCPMVTDQRADSVGMMQAEYVASDAYKRYGDGPITFPQPAPTPPTPETEAA